MMGSPLSSAASPPARLPQSRDRQLAILLLFGTVLSVVGAIGAIGNLAYDPLRLLWGFTCNAILLVG